MKKVEYSLLIVLGCLFSMASSASIQVEPMRAELDAKGNAIIKVRSTGSDTAYIRASLKQVMSPATASEYEQDAVIWDNSGLMLTPQKLIIPANSQRTLRLISMKPPEKETVYRVMVESVSAEGFPLASSHALSAGFGMNIIWGVVVNVPPRQPSIAFDFNRPLKRISNKGTQRIIFRKIESCNSELTKCQSHEVKRTLYPDQQWVIENDVVTGNKTKFTVYDWINKKEVVFVK
ncbi:hypothetical protein [Mangrovibacter phragmitis]|uniref:hypothetical protein n=1 Tax=Mangrovibacter phragmitis TaxID=1691903 RepID=UPI0035199C93